MDLQTVLNRYGAFPEATLRAIEKIAYTRTYKKDEEIISMGKQLHSVYIVQTGTVANISLNTNTDFLMSFYSEGEIFSPLHSLIYNLPCMYTFLALESTTIWILPSKDCHKLSYSHPAIKDFWLREVMHQTSLLEKKIIYYCTYDALSRYRIMCEKNPGLQDKFSQKILSMHLNICPETLSRIRRKYWRK